MRNKYSKGFTLIELMVVFAIFFITAGAGMVKFNQFTNSQILDSSTADVITFLHNTRINAVSQTMLGACTQSLQVYSVKMTPPGTYEMWAYCNGSNFALNKIQKLPAGITFDTGTSPEITFLVQSGFSSGGTILLKGSTRTKTIQIDTTGHINQQ